MTQVRRIRIVLAVLALVLGVADLRAATADEDMDAAAIGVLNELNLLRKSPSEYARHLEEHRRGFIRETTVIMDGMRFTTTEGPSAVDEAIAHLKSIGPLPPIAPSRALARAARDHMINSGRSGTTGHTGTDGSTPGQRINQYGVPGSASGEAISYGPYSARAIVVSLLVDDGVPDRGHRHTLLNPVYRVAGIAVGPHKIFRTICVINFADSITEK